MNDLSSTATGQRATILVGYGAFGLEVLRRLLASTAPRGVLTWEEPRGGGGPSERHLQDLALLWFPDPLVAASEQTDPEHARQEIALEMMRDLFDQIHTIRGDLPSEILFAEGLSKAADTLLSASGRAGRTGALPLGLDVIVLARPTSREVLGTLDRLLVRGMERLANNASLERVVQGAAALNFLAFYDFDNYWDHSDHGRTVRKAVFDSIEQWQKRRMSGKPAIGRFYLVDGRTGEGVREPFHRIDEITLMLEFLLFEGQRAGKLPRLYHPTAPNESPLATFSIRLIERSAGLLAHLAAARFGIGWLEYLAGAGAYRGAAEAVNVRERLEPFGPEELDRQLDADAIRRDVETTLDALARELTALPIGLPDWPQRVRRRYEETLRDLEIRIASKTNAAMGRIAETHLGKLPEELRAGIHADLHAEENPVPAGGVIGELEALVGSLARIDEVTPPAPEAANEMLQGVGDLHDKYAQFHSERVEVEGLRWWWPLFGLVLAAGLTPIAGELLDDIPRPDPLRFLLVRAFDALQWLNNPLVIGLVIFLLTWGVGAWAFQRSIAARVDRTRRFYTDADRGRFVDRLRSGLRPGGALRAPVDYLVDRLLADMALSIRGDVTRELGRVLARLRERRREILWLREQLRGFLRMHGFAGEDLQPEPGRLNRNGIGIRHSLERGEDFELMLQSSAPILPRFRSEQTKQAPFAGWDERYSRAFLVPLEFLDRLSSIYRDPFEQELARPGTGPEQQRLSREIVEYVTTLHSRFHLSLYFRAQDGVPPDQRFCLLPQLWRLNSVMAALSDLRIPEQSVITGSDAGRGYVLRLQAGIDPRCLVEPA